MRTELLAPAGSMAGLKAVTAAGADAVYIGGTRFGARAYADNPEEDDLVYGIEYAHLRGVKVYMTVNTLLKEEELSGLCNYMEPYVRAGLDAVLVQDFGVLRSLREAFPDLPLHASTQMTITGPLGAAMLKDCGVTRIVPARELSIEELAALKNESGLEVETFVHGALCYCYSGVCLMSSMIGGRSGNRGRCAQPCRLLNLLDDKTGFDGRTSIMDRKEARHFMSPKDLCAVDLLPELVKAGIDSLKIEGRMKQPEYAAGVVSVYRGCLDRALKDPDHFKVTEEEHRMLYDLYNRSGFTDGYYHRHNGPQMMALVKHELTREETDARHELYSKMHERYMDTPHTIPVSATFFVKCGSPLRTVMSCRCEGNTVTASAEGPVVQAAQKQPLSEERIREQALRSGGTDFEITAARVITDGGSFVPVSQLNALRRSGLEALREEVLSVYRRRTSIPDAPETPADAARKGNGGEAPILSVLVSTKDQLDCALKAPGVSEIIAEAALICGAPITSAAGSTAMSNAKHFIDLCKNAGRAAAIAMPRIDRPGRDAAPLKEGAGELTEAGLSYFLVRSFETLAFFKKSGLTDHVRTDASLYTYNSAAKEFLLNTGIIGDTAPVELNRRELSVRDNSGSDMIVYGHLPLMLSAQCLQKNTDRCNHAGSLHTLTDRTGTKFSVKCECIFCYNILYNYLPLSLFREMKKIRSMGFRSLRVELTLEDREESRRVLMEAGQSVCTADGYTARRDDLSTRGHFLRGVE